MTDRIFYVGSKNDRGLTGYVPAKFLMRNGRYVMDPMPRGSQNAYLYSDRWGNNQTAGETANPNNYLIVPGNYSEQQASDFANGISNILNQVYPEDETGTAGSHRAREQMITAFRRGGPQDLQRHPQWGIPNGSVVPAFVSSASNYLGYVTARAGLPLLWSQVGGGFANALNAGLQTVRRLQNKPATSIDTGGAYGLSRQNDANISQGYLDGLAASKPPTPLNDYGDGAQPQSSPGQIGVMAKASCPSGRPRPPASIRMNQCRQAGRRGRRTRSDISPREWCDTRLAFAPTMRKLFFMSASLASHRLHSRQYS
jgi:hypothetical protein